MGLRKNGAQEEALMLFGQSRFERGNPAATALMMASVLASVGCDRAESPFAPDFGVEEPSRLSVPAEQTSVEQLSEESPATEPTSISTDCRSIPPLVVIDGVEQPEDFPLSDVKALDIDHVEVVKGRAAILLYGPRARGGAIDIQTKRLLNGLKPR
ncbi:MAG: TonB-dependent receptor plug domain-containing protein [Gemmatimonadetes bacterium]|nr:TonB-dependent receptor plug domain-containing protein [Candidatus Palauibacter rhopaloidicola]